jgi:hypothetical protein
MILWDYNGILIGKYQNPLLNGSYCNYFGNLLGILVGLQRDINGTSMEY